MRSLLTLQLRVIGALVLRETRATFGTSQLGYLWAIVTPALGVAVFVLVFGAAGRRPPFGSSLALFFATGLLTLEFYKKLSTSLMTTFNANKALLTYPCIKETDTLFSRSLLISATYLVIMLVFYGTLVLFQKASPPHHPDQLIVAFFMICLLGTGVGIVNAVMLSIWESWSYVESILTRPLIIISGVFYIPSSLPPAALNVLQWNPVLHLIEWFRTGYYSNYNSTVLNKEYLFLFALLILLIGLIGERLTRKRRAGQ
ncbi:ABC transporter permease [Pontiellaceae bacterium B1224]|nr:ABC transporter permease [Pontiellaceae bacterium B1224]